MNTVTIENVDNKVAAAFKKMAEAIGASVSVKKEKKVKYDPELLKRVKEYESGNAKLVHKSLSDIQELLND